MLVESEEYVEVADLGEEVAGSLIEQNQTHGSASSIAAGELPVREVPVRFDLPAEGMSLETLEREIILSALQHSGGNVSKASRLLRIQRGKLRYRIERLGLSNEVEAILDGRRSQHYKSLKT
jgi:DNA-binding NtrC family response regulator